MYEVRIHGRGGQGGVTAANILALAGHYCNFYTRSFPFYGPERRGAPVVAFLRLDERPVRLRCGVYAPDCVMVIDPRLPKVIPVAAGLKEEGTLILNAPGGAGEASVMGPFHTLAVVDATSIALDVLGQPITNTVMLGAFARAYPKITIESVAMAIRETFGEQLGGKNARAAEIAYQATEVVTR